LSLMLIPGESSADRAAMGYRSAFPVNPGLRLLGLSFRGAFICHCEPAKAGAPISVRTLIEIASSLRSSK